MRTAGVVCDPLFKRHSNGLGHPESPARLEAIERKLQFFPKSQCLLEISPRDATQAQLERIHTGAYLRKVAASRARPFTALDPETTANSESYGAAVRAAGATLAAVDAVQAGECPSAFAFVRPPGHHAEANRAMGFCIFNNVAVAAAYALSEGAAERVLIVDWDVHHGNGTMHSFFDSDEVLYISIHQSPHYPGTGSEREVGRQRGRGFTVNVPLPPGMGDTSYARVFRDVVQPIATEYRPDLVLVSAGFDAHRLDPLAAMQSSSEGFADMTMALVDVADSCCDGKIVLVLEGGYNTEALAESVGFVLTALIGGWEKRKVGEDVEGVDAIINRIRETQRSFWSSIK